MNLDPAQSELALSDLQHRLSKLITLGTVHEVDYETARVKVKIGDWITAKLPWLTDMAAHNMTWRAPEIGEQVIVLAPCGDTAQGVILGSVYSAAADHHKPDHVLGAGESYAAASSREHVHRTRYQDGALVEYDNQNHAYHLYVPDTGGEETAKITIHSDRDIHIECGFNATIEVGNNASINVVNDASLTVGNDATVSAEKNMRIAAGETLTLEGKQVNVSSTEQNIAVTATGNLLLNAQMIKAQE
ncbi:phage baseplate assembly protein V [Pseudoalteromonas sp. OOF1S-7]|uniref:phage baseplate assembly protein V n=1 Tax=Pseudoalteromonas sp. OOF1S-7 TaxID=2917757 RepID=UPI001EF5CCBF|nr:phage baseplate assembly protein V [Pseudoalteromonas sp. OOF1S-7]MCG7536485.1 phage baseplate assembly protein V [Pseudoalteromonas sp. OOF1S-7]